MEGQCPAPSGATVISGFSSYRESLPSTTINVPFHKANLRLRKRLCSLVGSPALLGYLKGIVDRVKKLNQAVSGLYFSLIIE